MLWKLTESTYLTSCIKRYAMFNMNKSVFKWSSIVSNRIQTERQNNTRLNMHSFMVSMSTTKTWSYTWILGFLNETKRINFRTTSLPVKMAIEIASWLREYCRIKTHLTAINPIKEQPTSLCSQLTGFTTLKFMQNFTNKGNIARKC